MHAVSIIVNVVFGKLCVQYHILIEVFLGHCISAVVGSTPTAGHPNRFFPQSLHSASRGFNPHSRSSWQVFPSVTSSKCWDGTFNLGLGGHLPTFCPLSYPYLSLTWLKAIHRNILVQNPL